MEFVGIFLAVRSTCVLLLSSRMLRFATVQQDVAEGGGRRGGRTSWRVVRNSLNLEGKQRAFNEFVLFRIPPPTSAGVPL
jgi:hypothetical protein